MLDNEFDIKRFFKEVALGVCTVDFDREVIIAAQLQDESLLVQGAAQAGDRIAAPTVEAIRQAKDATEFQDEALVSRCQPTEIIVLGLRQRLAVVTSDVGNDLCFARRKIEQVGMSYEMI